jgi:hypothetical protein
MEVNLLSRRKSLESKIPEIDKTLQVVTYLMTRKVMIISLNYLLIYFIKDSDEPIETQYELADTLWANAKIPPTETVNLWLGVCYYIVNKYTTHIQANVMLEYPLEEARDLLTEKLGKAKQSLKEVKEDLDFLREQITTMEVNTARVYNWDVKLRRAKGVKA